MLDRYLKEFGISAFDEDFYLPPGKGDGVLLEKVGPTLPEVTEYTLEQARDGF
jgi:hypothetical protein